MKRINKYLIIIMILLLLPLLTFSQARDNEELRKMYEEDQSSRMVAEIDWGLLSKNDNIRKTRVYELIKSGKVITGKDYFHSAMIFQHGGDSVAYGMAVKHMKKAIQLDPKINKWLLAAAIDRELMSKNKPQIYGTQYVKKGHDAKWERYTIDTTQISDEERKLYKVETLAEQKIKERNMNLNSISDYYATSDSLNNTVQLIKTEYLKGKESTYDVSEGGINGFAYQLLQSGKINDALTIFTLNTKLYPDGFNTFDSLGECLLKLNKKEEAIIAYKRSLKLNPNNNNAEKVLNEIQD